MSVATRRVTGSRGTAKEAMPAYGAADGVLSFRHGLQARERSTIDRALEILGRYMRTPEVAFCDVGAVKHYLQLHLGGERAEHFAVIYLDAQHRSIAFERHFTGTLTQTSVYPREIVEAAMRYRAAAVILAHNHPSGSLLPSRADEMLTQTLKTTLSLIDVRVLDHVIVGGMHASSMAEMGLI